MATTKEPNGDAQQGDPSRASAPSAYFTSVSIRNFRCFGDEQQSISFVDEVGRPARWTILLGDNGAGKTSVLQCLAAFTPLQFNDDPPSKVLRKVLSFPSKGLLKYLSAVDRRSVVGGDLGTRPLEVCADTVSGGGLNMRGSAWQSHRLRYTVELHRVVGERAVNVFGSSFHRLTSYPRCYGYGAGRRLSSASLSDSAVDEASASLFSDDAVLRNAAEWLLKLDYSTSKPSRMKRRQEKWLSDVIELLVDLLPDVEDIRFDASSSVRPSPSVEFKTHYGWVPLESLGHGYRSSVAWIVDFASRLIEDNPDSKAPLSEPAVALVDEIDLHLHPVWQRSLLGHLSRCFPNTQFIASAHSPLVVQAAEEANLVLLKRDGNRVVVQNDLQAVKGWRVDQVLTSDLFGLESVRPPKYDDLLKERKAILTKSKLSHSDEKRLKEIDGKVGTLPAGDAETILRVQALLDEAKRISSAK